MKVRGPKGHFISTTPGGPLYVWMPANMADALRRWAKALDVSQSALIRRCVEQHLFELGDM